MDGAALWHAISYKVLHFIVIVPGGCSWWSIRSIPLFGCCD